MRAFCLSMLLLLPAAAEAHEKMYATGYLNRINPDCRSKMNDAPDRSGSAAFLEANCYNSEAEQHLAIKTFDESLHSGSGRWRIFWRNKKYVGAQSDFDGKCLFRVF
jgi:hypothetical protein